MKTNIITLLSVLTLAGSSLAQTVSIPQPDSVNVYQIPREGYPELFYLNFSYDENGLLIGSHKESSNPDTWWLEDLEYLYDENQLCQQINRSLDTYLGQYLDHFKTEYNWSDGRLDSEWKYWLYYYHRDYIWLLQDYHLYYYDSLGRLEAETYQLWDKVNNVRYEYGEGVSVKHIGYYTDSVWTNICTVTRTFSDDGRPLTNLRVKNGGSTLLTTYSYNEQGRIAEVLTKKELANGKLVNDRRGIYESNEEGWPVVVRFEEWNGQEWVDGYCYSFAYAPASYYDRDFFIFWEDHLKRQDEFMSAMVNIPIHRLEIHYADTPVPTYETQEQSQSQENNNIILIPNPSSGQATVNGRGIRRVEVFNLLGQKAASFDGNGSDSVTIGLEGLPQGVYLVTVQTSDGKYATRKLAVD